MNLHSALSRLEGTFAARIRKGITVSGITLRAADSDRTAFTQLLTMLNEAERMEMLPATTTIVSRDGIAHELPTDQVRAILVQYGGVYQSLWIQKVGLENTIKTSPDDATRAAIPILFV